MEPAHKYLKRYRHILINEKKIVYTTYFIVRMSRVDSYLIILFCVIVNNSLTRLVKDIPVLRLRVYIDVSHVWILRYTRTHPNNYRYIFSSENTIDFETIAEWLIDTCSLEHFVSEYFLVIIWQTKFCYISFNTHLAEKASFKTSKFKN